jgi:hypothetical protein
LLLQCRIQAKNRRKQACPQPPRLIALSASRLEPLEFFDVPTRRTSPLLGYPYIDAVDDEPLRLSVQPEFGTSNHTVASGGSLSEIEY